MIPNSWEEIQTWNVTTFIHSNYKNKTEILNSNIKSASLKTQKIDP